LEFFPLLLVQARKEREWAEAQDRVMERHPPGDTRASYPDPEPKNDPGSKVDRCLSKDESPREDLPISSVKNFKL